MSEEHRITRTYKCPECGATATIVSDDHDGDGYNSTTDLHAVLGCSNGHDTEDMYEVDADG